MLVAGRRIQALVEGATKRGKFRWRRVSKNLGHRAFNTARATPVIVDSLRTFYSVQCSSREAVRHGETEPQAKPLESPALF